MSDLIDRQVAIDALFGLYEYQRDIDPTEAADLVRQGIYLAEKKIEQLPSVQPEKRTEERTETHACDCISREDAKWVVFCNRDHVEDQANAIDSLPCVQPSAQPQHEVRFSDADHVWIDGKQYISLKRFGEVVKDAQPQRCEDCVNFSKTRLLIPQPEIIRCKDCKHYQFADNRAFGMPVKMCKWFGFEDVDDYDFCSRAERR